jgi:glycosyltransferase involved in cell wall biosynthesis
MPKLSVTIITRNEAANIADALASVSWADEIVVVDAESTDHTVAIARRYTDRVIVRAWPGFPRQKNHAADAATHDWILSIDADERVPPALSSEIRTLLREEPHLRGYRVPRVTWALGRWIRSTDWYPDWQLRLYDRRAGRWDESRQVHESVLLDGIAGRLREELHHLPYRDLSHHLQTIDRYTTLAARDMALKGERASFVEVMTHPRLAFFRNYVLKLGVRDAMPGLIVSLMNSVYVLLKYAKLWELQRRREVGSSGAAGEERPHPEG